MPEMDLDPPADMGELNRRVGSWLDTYVHAVAHRSTGVAPEVRMRTEKPLLPPLPRLRFDTARREARVVGRVPLAEWDGVFYSAPPEAAGHIVEARQAVDSPLLQLRLGGRLIAEHRIVAPGSDPQWLPEHRAAPEAIAMGRSGRHLRGVEAQPPPPPCSEDLDLGDGDYDVAEPDLGVFDLLGPEPVEASGGEASWGCGCFGGLG